MNHILLALAWLIFGVVHSLLAANQVKEWFSFRLGNQYRYYRLWYNLFSLLALSGILWFQWQVKSQMVFPSSIFTMVAGAVICGAGILLMLVSVRKYFLDLSGLFTEEEGETSQPLHVQGIHRYVRHPLYLGTFAFLWGGWMLLPTWSILVMNLVITLYTLAGIALEEKKLEKRFGEAYKKYRREVPMIFPKRIK